MDLLKLTLSCLLVVTVAIYALFKYCHSYWRRKGVPYLRPHFFFGNVKDLFAMKGTEAEIFDQLYKKLKRHKFSGLYFLWKPIWFPTDPELIKRILVTDHAHFLNHPDVSSSKGTDRVGHSLFTMKDVEWKKRRAVFNTAFTPMRLKAMYAGVESNCRKILPVMDEAADAGGDLEMEATSGRYAVNVITSALFGLDTDTLENSNSVFLRCGELITRPKLSTVIKFMAYLQFPGLSKKMGLITFDPACWEFFSRLVADVVRQREEAESEVDDLLGMIIKMKNRGGESAEEFKMTLDEITSHMFTLFVAGYDTTALTTAFCLYELSGDAAVQNRLRREVDAALAPHGGRLSYDALRSVPFLDAVVAETLRLYPPAGIIRRECTVDYQVPGTDVTVPAGTHVVVPVYSLQRDPLYFPEPDKFRPDRFIEVGGKVPAAYLPFGKGPRICIGMKLAEMEIKIALALMLSRYEFLPSDKMELPLKMDPNVLFVTTRPMNGLWVKVKHRDDKKDF